MPSATANGVVAHDVPGTTRPSGSRTEMGSRGLAASRARDAAAISSYTASRARSHDGSGASANGVPSFCGPADADAARGPDSAVRRVLARPASLPAAAADGDGAPAPLSSLSSAARRFFNAAFSASNSAALMAR